MFHIYVFFLLSFLASAMFVVAWLFESRVPGRDTPIWRNQSKAFFPGDFGLALFVGSIAQPVLPTLWSTLAGVVACGGALFVLRHVTYDKNGDDYTLQAWNSPSKRYHDYIIAFAFAFTAVIWVLPITFGWVWPVEFGHPVVSLPWLFCGVGGLVIWAGGVVWDEKHTEVPNEFQHPAVYQSLWQTWLEARQ